MLKNDPASWMRSRSLSLSSLIRTALLASDLNGPGFAFTKKNVYRIRHDVRVQL